MTTAPTSSRWPSAAATVNKHLAACAGASWRPGPPGGADGLVIAVYWFNWMPRGG